VLVRRWGFVQRGTREQLLGGEGDGADTARRSCRHRPPLDTPTPAATPGSVRRRRAGAGSRRAATGEGAATAVGERWWRRCIGGLGPGRSECCVEYLTCLVVFLHCDAVFHKSRSCGHGSRSVPERDGERRPWPVSAVAFARNHAADARSHADRSVPRTAAGLSRSGGRPDRARRAPTRRAGRGSPGSGRSPRRRSRRAPPSPRPSPPWVRSDRAAAARPPPRGPPR
jgi:hypothetical protein